MCVCGGRPSAKARMVDERRCNATRWMHYSGWRRWFYFGLPGPSRVGVNTCRQPRTYISKCETPGHEDCSVVSIKHNKKTPRKFSNVWTSRRRANYARAKERTECSGSRDCSTWDVRWGSWDVYNVQARFRYWPNARNLMAMIHTGSGSTRNLDETLVWNQED